MIVLVSPAKNMRENSKHNHTLSAPCLANYIPPILKALNRLSVKKLQQLMKINEKLAQLNKDRYQQIQLDTNGFPAILTYDGIQYKNIDASNFSLVDTVFAQKHIRILSGLYGILKPYDSIYPYRLDALTPIKINAFKNLYDYWQDHIYEQIVKEDDIIINLASKEYSKLVEKYMDCNCTFITCTFKVRKENALKVESTASKQARGLMVNYIIKNKLSEPNAIKLFNLNGFCFSPEHSTATQWIFIK